jgi:hypothetical protein
MDLETLRAAVAEAEKAKNGSSAAKPAKVGAKKPDLKVIQGGKSEPAEKAAPTKAKTSGKKKATPTEKPVEKTAKTKKATPAKAATKAKTSKSAPAAKSTTQKSAPAKGAAAKGEAKRPTSGAKVTKAKPTANSDDVIRRSTQGGHVGVGGYTNIDVSGIDWGAETTVGTSGKRKETLDLLRKHKGDTAEVFKALRHKAAEWYPNAYKAYPTSPTKLAASERQLRWLIARVRYDFASKTGQHAGRAQAKAAIAKKAASKKTTAKAKTGTRSKVPSKTASKGKAPSAVQKAKAAPVRRGLARKG